MNDGAGGVHRFGGAAAWLLAAAAAVAGCADSLAMDTVYAGPWRARRGLVVILPGIEGESALNRAIREGLDRGGAPYALVIHNWGFPVPGLGLVINQTNVLGNRAAAKKLAELIVDYQAAHPGRPVFLVGHSGGGGIAVFALEAMGERPGARPVDGAVLLSASLSANYDMTKALKMTRRGVVNFHDEDDTVLLLAGTKLMGNVDGGRGASCGRTGFTRAFPRLFNRRVGDESGEADGPPHFRTAQADRVARWVVPWLLSPRWPPPEPVGAAGRR